MLFVLAPQLLIGGRMGDTTETAHGLAGDQAMARYAGGDDGAFADVYAVIAPRLTSFFRRRLLDKSAVSDLMQETLLRVHRARTTFVRGSTLLPWVLTIARRLLIDVGRRAGRERQRDTALLDVRGGASAPSVLPNGEEIVAAKQMVAQLDQTWARVSEPQRAALWMVRGEGLSTAEAAAKLGTTVIGVKLRTHRASRALQAGIAAHLAAA